MNHDKPSKAEIQKWVDALRSGEYKQAKGQLEVNGRYCYLGVACKLFIPNEKTLFSEDAEIYGYIPRHQPKAPRWLREVTTSCNLPGLADLNDTQHFTFTEIADVLELVYFHAKLLPLRK